MCEYETDTANGWIQTWYLHGMVHPQMDVLRLFKEKDICDEK